MHHSTLKPHGIPCLMFAALAALLISITLVGAQTINVKPTAQPEVPGRALQTVLIKATLLTFNDANLTGNYTVLHARLSKPFREQITPEKLAEVFKPFQQINLRSIITKRHTATVPASIDDGILKLSGYFEEGSNRLYYVLTFVREDEDWRPLRIDVNIKPISEPDAKAKAKAKKADRAKKPKIVDEVRPRKR